MENKQELTTSPIEGEVVILNKETYDSLLSMLKSSDSADWKIAQLILNRCDVEKSIYWIWELARRGFSSRMVNLRTKDSRKFRDESHLFTISYKNAREFAYHLNRSNILTSEIYQKLEEEIISQTKNQCTNTFYDVTLTIKEKYKHLTLNQQPIIIY